MLKLLLIIAALTTGSLGAASCSDNTKKKSCKNSDMGCEWDKKGVGACRQSTTKRVDQLEEAFLQFQVESEASLADLGMEMRDSLDALKTDMEMMNYDLTDQLTTAALEEQDHQKMMNAELEKKFMDELMDFKYDVEGREEELKYANKDLGDRMEMLEADLNDKLNAMKNDAKDEYSMLKAVIDTMATDFRMQLQDLEDQIKAGGGGIGGGGGWGGDELDELRMDLETELDASRTDMDTKFAMVHEIYKADMEDMKMELEGKIEAGGGGGGGGELDELRMDLEDELAMAKDSNKADMTDMKMQMEMSKTDMERMGEELEATLRSDMDALKADLEDGNGRMHDEMKNFQDDVESIRDDMRGLGNDMMNAKTETEMNLDDLRMAMEEEKAMMEDKLMELEMKIEMMG